MPFYCEIHLKKISQNKHVQLHILSQCRLMKPPSRRQNRTFAATYEPPLSQSQPLSSLSNITTRISLWFVQSFLFNKFMYPSVNIVYYYSASLCPFLFFIVISVVPEELLSQRWRERGFLIKMSLGSLITFLNYVLPN